MIGPTALVLIAIELVSKIEIVAVRITTFGKDRTLLNLFAEENIIFFQKPPWIWLEILAKERDLCRYFLDLDVLYKLYNVTTYVH